MPRLSKRAQREQETLASLQQGVPEGVAASDEEESEPETRPKLGFASLNVLEPDDDDSGDDAAASTPKKSKPKKKKKKPVKPPQEVVPPPPPPIASTSSAPTPAISKKERKKAKKLDDIDLALQELALKEGTTFTPGSQSGPNATSSSSTVQKFRELLATVPKFLDGDAELRRFFGSKVVNTAKQGPKHRSAVVRSQLSNPQPTWPMVRMSQGLAMRPLEPSEADRKIGAYPGEKWWTVEHSPSYKAVELHFLETVALGDYQGFMDILARQPWHIDSLLQMSEVARHQEDNTQASDLVARSLFAFERAFSPAFNITTGLQRLDFDRIENRPFFLALARYIVNLQKRGTNRTAFEFARLLFSLEPGTDPHGALMYLDYLAVRAGMNEWLVELWDVWAKLAEEDPASFNAPRVDIRLLPGWAYSRALALWNIEDKAGDHSHLRSTNALREAIHTFPYILPILADKANISLSGEIRGDPAFRISTGWDSFAKGESTLHLLSHIYAQRASELWKVPEVADWVRSSVDSALLTKLASITSPTRVRAQEAYKAGTPENFVRHVIVAENRSVMTFFSPNAVPQTMNAYDPVPPRSSLSQYDEEYFHGVAVKERGAEGRRRQQQMQQQMQGADEEEMAQIQEMIMQEIRERQRLAGDVPGGFPEAAGEAFVAHQHEGEVDSDIDDHDEEDEEDEEEEDVPAATGGFMQTMYNLVWRRGGNDGDGNREAT